MHCPLTRSDEQVAPALDLPQLQSGLLSSVHDDRSHSRAVRELAALVEDLRGQLARGRQHQHGRASGARAAALLRAQVALRAEHHLDHREQERSGL